MIFVIEEGADAGVAVRRGSSSVGTVKGELMIDPQLEGKVALVTGANHGIGAATAKALAAQARAAGLGGVLLYQANQQLPAETVVQHIRSCGGIAAAHEMDLSVVSQIPLLFDLCEKELGPVDILVNNHAYCAYDTFDPGRETLEGFGIHLISGRDIDVSGAINTRSYALLMSEYIRRSLQRKAGWGRIVNVSTDAAHAHEAAVSYAASKHAIESYSRSAALEVGRYGITVNVVAPGPIQTGYLTPDQEAHVADHTPLRRIGRPGDVADVVVFLASEQAHWLTGQLLYVGGGWRMPQ
jgi:3-oxoacyl-[acyl-carrier protein] reductase